MFAGRRQWAVAAVAMAAMLALLVIAAARLTGVVAVPHESGYFFPVFAPDGQSVFVVRRDVRALVAGFGWEGFTPPARVRVLRDRFDLLNIRLADGSATVVESFPPSALEGRTIEAYHGAIFGDARAHLRWADASHMDYEIAVTSYDVPQARTFVVRKVWNPGAGRFDQTGPWRETSATMSGDEPQQLHGDLEAIAVHGNEQMPCAIAVLRRGDTSGRAIVETRACREKYPGGFPAAVLAPLSRRADIERFETIRSTYAELIERGRRAGLPEGQAMLDAGEEMSRLGLFPKPTKLVAASVDCANAAPIFEIKDEEFRVGLFQDIERAIASPGHEVNKSMGAYISHRDYTTSREINTYLAAGHSSFVVRARGACWDMRIEKQKPGG
jgi:hypothetical protein